MKGFVFCSSDDELFGGSCDDRSWLPKATTEPHISVSDMIVVLTTRPMFISVSSFIDSALVVIPDSTPKKNSLVGGGEEKEVSILDKYCEKKKKTLDACSCSCVSY